MAVSEIDEQLIDKQMRGSLTAKEHAMWSRRMQDQGFLQAWHQAQDIQMRSSISDDIPPKSSEQKPKQGWITKPRTSGIWLVAISILIILVLIFLTSNSM